MSTDSNHTPKDSRAAASMAYVDAASAISAISTAKAQFARECSRRTSLLEKFQSLAMAEAMERTGNLLDVGQVFAVSPEVESLLRQPTAGLWQAQHGNADSLGV